MNRGLALSVMEAVFWISVLFVVYTYIGYPLTLVVAAFFAGKPLRRDRIEPSVTLIIAAHNEEKDIGDKLANSCALDYPEGMLEILVVSDHSTDGTDKIVAGHGDKRIRLIRTPVRSGKTGAQNLAIGHARGDIIVFSDATTIYDKCGLRTIVRNFSDGRVGGAEGRLVYLEGESGFMGNKDLLKSYEAWIKTRESLVWGGVGDNGAFYAIRKDLCRPLRPDLTSDFAAPLDVARQGMRFVFDPEAISYEKVSSNSLDEFRRKIRTVRAGVNVFFNSLDLLNPIRYGWISYVLFGRKFCRWFSSIMLIAAFLANLFLLDRKSYAFFFALQVSFYLLSFIGIATRDACDKMRFVSVPKSFVLVNLAALQGIASYLKNRNTEVWTPKRG